jgi:molybdopterin/thiamine biosynthesis adenylyltransferase
MSYHGRFEDLEWYGQPQEIIVGGTGGIGSWLCFFLARIGHHLYIYDNDIIDYTNFGGQLFPISEVNKPKTEIVKKLANDFSENDNIETFELYDETSLVSPIMFSSFDNMKARKIMFNKWKQQEDKLVFIDSRMQAEYFEIYVVTPNYIKEYEEYLFDDNEVADLPCSAKATSHCGAMCGAMAVSLFNNFITNQQHPLLRDVPFKTTINLPLMIFTIE